ncbi:MAG: AmmeMemoRadiSam system protein B, partial [Planctomycetota bacterium]
ANQDAALYSFTTLCSASTLEYTNVPRPQMGPQVRPPALAGKFYPADATELQRTIDSMVPATAVEKKPWRAAMVPHAGLRFSGRIAGETLARVELPDTIIVIGPKHTAAGMNHAIAPHATWSLPGITIPSDIELAQTLAQTLPDLQLDAAAHQNEHGIEVVLPFLHRFAPQSRVIGIALGRGEWELCERIGEGLAQVIGARQDRILLVISSDMNHFAEDAENRRRDELAMTALESLEPRTVLETVRKNEISMCGVIPACAILHGLSKMAPLQRAERVAYATSADVSGDKSRVVGYCGMLFE